MATLSGMFVILESDPLPNRALVGPLSDPAALATTRDFMLHQPGGSGGRIVALPNDVAP